MEKIHIDEVKCGITDGGMACGPVGGNIVTTIKFTEKDMTQFLSLVEVMGLANFYLTDSDIFELLMLDTELEEERFEAEISPYYIEEFKGIELDADYDEIDNSLAENEDNPASKLIKYIIRLTSCSMEELPLLIEKGKNKDLQDIEFNEEVEEA